MLYNGEFHPFRYVPTSLILAVHYANTLAGSLSQAFG